MEFDIRGRVKYGEEWDYDETRTWMKETEKACKNEYGNCSEDYKQYKKSEFTALEENIAVNMFGISEEFSKRAYKGTGILRCFQKDQRVMATKTRQKMEEIAGSHDFVEMQVVPILARMDDDLHRDKSLTEKQRLAKEENKSTGRIFVFRIKDSKGNPKFLDCQLRTYDTWEDYLSGNKSPQCIYCYPKDGFLRKQITSFGIKTYAANDVQFGEPPSCNLLNRAKDTFDTVIMYATPFIVVASFWCPASWGFIATGLSYASTALLVYNLAAQGIHIYDKIAHDEDFGASLMTLLTSIGTMMITQGLSRYLRSVAAAGRALSSMESMLITGILMGLKGFQLGSFVYMVISLASKPKIEPMDVIGLVVACHNLYSCVVSPWNAEQLLQSVKNQMQAENMKAIEKQSKLLKSEKTRLESNQANLEELRRQGGNQADIAKLEEKIRFGQDRVAQLESGILKSQGDFLDNKGKWMEDEGARREYETFRRNAMEDPAQRGENSEIDQNGRIIKAVTYMDAEQIFKTVSITGSKLQFANGETLDLLINAQLEVHPRALDQMNRILRTDENGQVIRSNDLKKMMELTKAYTDSTSPNYAGNREHALATYLQEIKPCLKYYQMITRKEIEIVKQKIHAQTQDENLRQRFDRMSPAEAYRMRTVLSDAPDRTLDLAYRMATAHNNNNGPIPTHTLAAWVEIVKMENNNFEREYLPDNLQRRLEYYDQVREWEIAGLQQPRNDAERANAARAEEELRLAVEENRQADADRIREEQRVAAEQRRVEAENIANENRIKREILHRAREARKNGEEVNMAQVAKDNSVPKTRFQIYHQQTFAEWNGGPDYFDSLQDPAAFQERMNHLTAEINRINEIAQRETLTISDPVSAFYHVMKHGLDSRNYFLREHGWTIPEDQWEQNYFTSEKDFIFKSNHQENKFISQDGSLTSTVYRDGKGYFGVIKCKYDEHLGREVGQPIVATHFER